jgi:GAF domain-containing protein
MAEVLFVDHDDKEANYRLLLPQLKSLCVEEHNHFANQANIVAAIKQSFGFFWVGFYWVDNDDELVLGAFQGPIACTRIKKGKGVCGTAWMEQRTVIVDDVDTFPGHIACSADAKSEIVVPILKDNKVVGILDIDSNQLATFDKLDEQYLTKICTWIGENIV